MSTNSFFGLSSASYEKLKKLLSEIPEIEQVKIFGSRAMGTHREGSDIDIVLYGKGIDHKLIRKTKIAYENLNLPYQLDLINYDEIDHSDLKVHIDTCSRTF